MTSRILTTTRTDAELAALHQLVNITIDRLRTLKPVEQYIMNVRILNAVLMTTMERECAAMQKEIEVTRVEIAHIEARIFASNRHLFTITFPAFPGPRVALLEVRGAANQDHAREMVWSAFPGCLFTFEDGDQTGGHAAYLYLWCSSAAQEVSA